MKRYGSYLMLGAFAAIIGVDATPARAELSPPEARAKVEQATASWSAKDKTAAVAALNQLVSAEIPVEAAYALVETSINQGVKGSALAATADAVSHAVKTDRMPADAAIRTASHAVERGQNAGHVREALEAVKLASNRLGSGGGSGAGAGAASIEHAVEVVTTALDRGVQGRELTRVATEYAATIKEGRTHAEAMKQVVSGATNPAAAHESGHDIGKPTASGFGGGMGSGGGSGMGAGNGSQPGGMGSGMGAGAGGNMGRSSGGR